MKKLALAAVSVLALTILSVLVNNGVAADVVLPQRDQFHLFLLVGQLLLIGRF